MQLQDRVALITGAGSGIGKATAVLMAKEGAKVAALSRTEEELEETVREVEACGGEGMVITADVSKAGDMERAIREVVERWGRLDVVFANAGVNGVWAPVEELEVDEWEKTIAINLTGTFLTLKYAVPHLKKQGGSVIVNASVNGTRVFSNSGATAYASSKAGQVAMTKMLALELARARVRVNVICPGAIDTEIDENTERRNLEGIGVPQEFPEGPHPLRGKPGTSQQVAQLVLFLASDASSHVTGTEVWIDGGESLLGLKG
ncbi:MAG TPA: SDR family NAD(P)-dependent oxidoreductase [Longimicrobiaceae bacterium]|nr:SDR family NAD(P)-dependent oxidoreductase [Longimicrobiaceae bacterium]